MEINVLDFTGDQDASAEAQALAAARDGDVVYFPGGLKEYEAPSNGLRITRSIEVFGDGPSDPGDNLAGTTFVPAGSETADDVMVVEPTLSSSAARVRLRDFKVARRSVGGYYDGHQGIRCEATGGDIHTIRLERINVQRMNAEGIIVSDGTEPGGGVVESLLMRGCYPSGCNGVGLTIRNVGRAVVIQGSVAATAVDGWLIEGASVALYQPSVDASPDVRNGHISLENCPVAIVDAAHFENFGLGSPEACLIEGGAGGGPIWLGSCRFSGQYPDPIEGCAGVRVAGSTEGPVFIGPNYHTRLYELVNLQIAAGCTVLPQMYLQENTDGAGSVVLQSGARVTASSVNYLEGGGVSAPAYAGLSVPSKSDGDPTWAVQNGMLYYDSSSNQRLRVRIANVWKTVVLD